MVSHYKLAAVGKQLSVIDNVIHRLLQNRFCRTVLNTFLSHFRDRGVARVETRA